jgi:molybdopterin/thiamine biosynthesis adenylyltransferase
MSVSPSLDAAQFIRHSRSIMLWGETSQQRLAGKQVLILGLGGLGSHLALALAAAGVGSLVLIDDDKVELSNLPRQTLYQQSDVGQPKVHACLRALKARNPHTQLTGYAQRPDAAQLQQWAHSCDLLLDCSDNLPTRLQLNQASRNLQRPLFSAAISANQAQLYLLSQQQACYRCLAGDLATTPQNCATQGVHPVLAALTAQQLAFFSLQYLLGEAVPLDQLALWHHSHFQFYPLDRDLACPVCADEHSDNASANRSNPHQSNHKEPS